MIKEFMRTHQFAYRLIAWAVAMATGLSANAQQSQPANLDTPPKLEKLEEGQPPAVTIREPKGAQTITEKRDSSGQVKEVKVTKGKNTYSVKPNPTPATALPGDGQRIVTHPAQWEVYEFNKNKKKKVPDAEADVAPPPPASAPAAPTSK